MKNSEPTTFYFSVIFFSVIFFLLFIPACKKQNPTRKTIPFSKVTTLAGTNEKFGEPFGVAVHNRDIFVSDGQKGKIWRISEDGAMQIFADNLNTPSQIVFDREGNLIVADSGANTIKRIKPTGEIEIVAGVENQGGFADGNVQNALFNAPIGVAVFENKIFVADTYNDRIRLIENGQVSTISGGEQGFADAENGSLARFDTPCGLAITKDGNLLVADAGNRRLRVVEQSGKTWTMAGNGEQDSVDGSLETAKFVEPLAVTIGNSGEIYVADGNSIRIIGRRFFPFVETISNIKRGYTDGELRNAKFNRPSSLAMDESGNLFVADADNQVLRVFTGLEIGEILTADEIRSLEPTAEQFRNFAEPRWTYDPPENKREIAGTLGEIRGEVSNNGAPFYFHNGLDIVGDYGETARFVRTEKVLHPIAVQNFDTLRELIRMPTLGYIHIRLGRDSNGKIFNDKRFEFKFDEQKKPIRVRVPRGAKFVAGEAIGTLNPMNHVHLIAGGSGAEMNALDALRFPQISDKISPVIEQISLFDENWIPVNETKLPTQRIKLSGKTRIVVRAFDRMDGNAERRRLGVFSLGYQILREDKSPVTDEKTTISFALLPDSDFVRLVYAMGSKSGATGETIFNYIVSNEVSGDFGKEGFLDAATLDQGNYVLRVFAADYFGNKTVKDLEFEIIK
ncbi:hypothetical protein BH10ACI1_BH10ACI1_29120 [soil metagenome]